MCLQQEHKPKSNNTKLKSKNHKPRNINTNTNPATYIPCQPITKTTNTNPATYIPCQPNTKKTNTNPNPNISKKWVQGADYNGFLQIRLLRRPRPIPKRQRSRTELGPKSQPRSELELHRDLEFRQIDQNDRVEIGDSDLDLPARCREFGSRLKKETSVIREVTSCAVMDFLASLDADASVP